MREVRWKRSITITWFGSERSPTLHSSKVTFSRLSKPTKHTSRGSGTAAVSAEVLRKAHDANASGPPLQKRIGSALSELEKVQPTKRTLALEARWVSIAGEVWTRSKV